MEHDKERFVTIIKGLKEKDEEDYENLIKIIMILMKNKKLIKKLGL
ncbi:TPA: hypothetical protein KQG29_000956 [Clostridioides difficile]|nr:hypothetical protein [Clostridioides difficile]